jgi:signal transduction histidine kinase
MEEVKEFFKDIFRYDQWPPRWKCGYWSDFHGWLYIISELMVWTAYFLIPLIIINYFMKRRATIQFRRVYILFATFILLCGSTHFIDALMFWVPMYRFNAVVRFATGVVSLFTVYHLMKVLPEVFKQRTNLELEREITLRQEAERKLAEANKDLQAFAYAASHDLQEPLRKIRMFSTQLYEHNKDRFDEVSRANTEKIMQASGRMRVLIQDILSLSTISDEALLEAVDTAAIVQQAMDDLEVRIKEKSAHIEVGALPMVKGNAGYLGQLFFNLISNALKFTERTPVVKIWGEVNDGRVHIHIQDNGIGIKPEDKEKIFEVFKRVHSKEAYEGTGIGLAIVKKIVDVHGGDLSLVSEPGIGTTFTIALQPA